MDPKEGNEQQSHFQTEVSFQTQKPGILKMGPAALLQIHAVNLPLTPPQRGLGRSHMLWKKGNPEIFEDGWTLSLK